MRAGSSGSEPGAGLQRRSFLSGPRLARSAHRYPCAPNRVRALCRGDDLAGVGASAPASRVSVHKAFRAAAAFSRLHPCSDQRRGGKRPLAPRPALLVEPAIAQPEPVQSRHSLMHCLDLLRPELRPLAVEPDDDGLLERHFFHLKLLCQPSLRNGCWRSEVSRLSCLCWGNLDGGLKRLREF